MSKELVILGFETSCDETAVAIMRGDDLVVNTISSQVEIHAPRARRRVLRARHVAGRVTLGPAPAADAHLPPPRRRRLRAQN